MSDAIKVKHHVAVPDHMAVNEKKQSLLRLPKTRKEILEERFEKLKPAQKVKFMDELERRKIRMDKNRANMAKRRKMAKANRKRNRMN